MKNVNSDDLKDVVEEVEIESSDSELELDGNASDDSSTLNVSFEKNEEISDVEEKNLDFKLKFMQIAADFSNYKRRIDAERADWGYLAQSDVVLKILPFSDDLVRAIEAGDKLSDGESKSAWIDGFKLVQKNLNKTFEDLDIKEIDSSLKFDPEYHEALIQVESKKHKSGEIVDVIQKGYTFRGKVLKHAKVSVAK